MTTPEQFLNDIEKAAEANAKMWSKDRKQKGLKTSPSQKSAFRKGYILGCFMMMGRFSEQLASGVAEMQAQQDTEDA